VIGADATSIEDLEKLFDAATAKFGKIDFILHSIGMVRQCKKRKTLY
jgi:enoyl-[acyl-carrier protein] reductase I